MDSGEVSAVLFALVAKSMSLGAVAFSPQNTSLANKPHR